MKKISVAQLEKKARSTRKLILNVSHNAGVGHISSSLSIADIMTVLYQRILRIYPNNPTDQRRDRFILSKGHAGLAQYIQLYMRGFISKKQLFSFCTEDGAFGLHPEYAPQHGIEMSTGSLGHGLSVGAGMAYAFKKSHNRKQKVYVLLSDAELDEGSTWEAFLFAAHHNLDNLVAIVDDNSLQAFGRTEDVLSLSPITEKLSSFCWCVREVNGHSITDLISAFESAPFKPQRPCVVVAHTTAGRGVPFMEGTLDWHYFTMTDKQYKKAMKTLR